jgi:hypothetical protein
MYLAADYKAEEDAGKITKGKEIWYALDKYDGKGNRIEKM